MQIQGCWVKHHTRQFQRINKVRHSEVCRLKNAGDSSFLTLKLFIFKHTHSTPSHKKKKRLKNSILTQKHFTTCVVSMTGMNGDVEEEEDWSSLSLDCKQIKRFNSIKKFTTCSSGSQSMKSAWRQIFSYSHTPSHPTASRPPGQTRIVRSILVIGVSGWLYRVSMVS